MDPGYEAIFRSALGDAYDFHTVKRTGEKSDGVAVLLRRGRWDVRSSRGLSLSRVGDRVALVMHLRSLEDGVKNGKDMILVNTHLAFPHSLLDRMNQIAQIKVVTDAVDRFVRDARLPTMTPRVVVGDLNVEESDPVCRHLSSNGFRSAFTSLHRERRVITHFNHRGEQVGHAARIEYRRFFKIELYFSYPKALDCHSVKKNLFFQRMRLYSFIDLEVSTDR